MSWVLNKASIISREHEFSKKNKQDFFHAHVSPELLIGVVCDGCGESKYSEVGSALLSTFVVNFLRDVNPDVFSNVQVFKQLLEYEIDLFIERLEGVLFFNVTTQPERISFIKEFMLSTCLFCVITKDKVVVANCGDGVIIVNNKIHEIYQQGRPEYIAYKSVPKEALEQRPSELEFFTINIFDCDKIENVVIGTDGIQPLIDKNLVLNLYRTQKRQLQRKFNIWQNDGLFGDDATCIVIERQNGDENSKI